MHHWEAGVQYNLGDKVEYHGKRYNIIQPHRSQNDWTPDRTPALWGVVPYADCDDDYKEKHKEHAFNKDHQEKPVNQWNPPPPMQQRQEQQEGGPARRPEAPHQTVQIKPEEEKKNWYDLSDERKKQLAIGGGLAAGVALLGAGFAAYKHHEKSEEEEKALVWQLQNYMREAQARTQHYHQEGPNSPATWVLVQGKNIPQNAIVGGAEDGHPIYVARSFHEGGIHCGKASPSFPKGGIIGYDRDEIDYDAYEVLVGDIRGLRWVDVHGKLNVESLGARPVEGGREKNGEILYIAQGEVKGETICGKVGPSRTCAFIPADDKEHDVKNYRVLCYA